MSLLLRSVLAVRNLAIQEIGALLEPVDIVRLHIYLKTTSALPVQQQASLVNILPLFVSIVKEITLLIAEIARHFKQLNQYIVHSTSSEGSMEEQTMHRILEGGNSYQALKKILESKRTEINCKRTGIGVRISFSYRFLIPQQLQ